MLLHLSTLQTAVYPAAAPRCLLQAEYAGTWCESQGWAQRPTWADVAAGMRPPTPDPTTTELGEWRHGWQYYASNAAEDLELVRLKQVLAWPNNRSNAACTGKARLWSCTGRFAAAWMVTAPRSDATTFLNVEMHIAMKRRLGMAISYEGPDAHGYANLTTNVGGRLNARHLAWLVAWRQVMSEAGGQVPDRNVERMLQCTNVPVPPGDTRRLDLVVPGLNVARGLPLVCDVTVLSPLTGTGQARPGTSNIGGRLLEQATIQNNNNYPEVITSGLGALYCLGAEVYGRMCKQAVDLLPELARERCRGLHPRLRRGTALGLLHRWSGILSVGLQRGVAHVVANEYGADLTVIC